MKGTNSLDKLNGSRLFLEYISKRNVTGVIATHDLELSKLEDENPQRFHNYSFEIELGTNVTYTYKIGRGVAKNQNATFLLKTNTRLTIFKKLLSLQSQTYNFIRSEFLIRK